MKLTLQYDGTNFVGWQRQAIGVSIQQLLEEAISPIEGGAVTVIGAGRTDAGVHALGQVASVNLTSSLTTDAFVRALNARLPPDVRVLDVVEAPEGFHARYHARAKAYQYRIFNGPIVSPFDFRYLWHVPASLDVAPMQRTAADLEGRHDFAAFRGAGSSTRTSARTLHAVRVSGASGGTIVVDVEGEGFLRHMVRNIVGTLVEIGEGRRDATTIERTIASGDRKQAGPTAPAHGLFLMRVDY